MIRRLLITAPSIVFALLILFVSIYRASSVRFIFGKENISLSDVQAINPVEVNYALPENKMSPESLFWPVKAVTDKVELAVSQNSLDKAKIALKYADERLVAGDDMLQEGKVSDGLVVLTKAEDYLLQSSALASQVNSLEARELLKQISMASLKHREILEGLLAQSPDEIRSFVVTTLDKPKLVYKESRVVLELFGDRAPHNPFDER